MQLLLFVLGFLLFIGLVLIHEWGHYIAARRNGVVVEEFGLGFPPRAWGKKLKDGMVLSLNWLPLGGFVKLKGESDSDKRKGSFGAASLPAKTQIMLAGVTMNLIAGLLILTILALVGLPKLIDNQFTVASDTKISQQSVAAGFVEPGSPADKAGLTSRDSIKQITSPKGTLIITSTEQLKAATKSLEGQKVQITYEHRGQEFKKDATLLSRNEVQKSLSTDNPKGHLGVVPLELQVRRSTWSAPVVALGFTKQLVVLTMQGLGKALGGLGSTIAGLLTGNQTAREQGQAKASSQVGGPVAIMAVLWGGGSLGINFILMIIAVLSLTLALINILPIPALDGGRLVVTLVSRKLLKNPISRAAEERIHGTGMAVLLALVLLITIVDVKRFF
ncbi:site-2 protease family protein [Candidatus Saccharibacteria bacterium]|nr:site-2 protease family protein [Candidatus Saccharibacteria bacterium]